jgi:hypothetical protein
MEYAYQIQILLFLTTMQQKDKDFIKYWELKRLENKNNPLLFVKGFSLGLFIGGLCISMLGMEWYQRANMVANAKMNPIVLFIAIIILATGLAILYNNFKWEQNEQYYNELLSKEKKNKQL